MNERRAIIVILTVQAVCAFVFVSDVLMALFGVYVRPIPWELRELLEIGAAAGLILGVILGGVALHQTRRRRRAAEEKLRRASGAFMELLNESFLRWGLTPAESDVAMFLIKGLSTQEIALLRQTSDGTVKAQTAAIYRKAGVSGRPQLLSLFIEDLIEGKPSERVVLAEAS